MKKALAQDKILANFPGTGAGPENPAFSFAPAFSPTDSESLFGDSATRSCSSTTGASLSTSCEGRIGLAGRLTGMSLSTSCEGHIGPDGGVHIPQNQIQTPKTQSPNHHRSNLSSGPVIPMVDQSKPGQRRALARYQAMMENGKSYCPDFSAYPHPNHNPEGELYATETREVAFVKCPFPNNLPYNPYNDSSYIVDPQGHRIPSSLLFPPYFNQFDCPSLDFNAPFSTFSFSRPFFLETSYSFPFSADFKFAPLSTPSSSLALFKDNKRLPALDYQGRFALLRSLLGKSLGYALSPQVLCIVKDHLAPFRSCLAPRFVRFCSKCGGSLVTSLGNCTFFPLHSVCRCRPYQPVILDPSKMNQWYLTIQYSEGFQRADAVTKASMLEALGYDYNDLVLKCGMAGPVAIQNVGADLRDREDVYYSFLVNGLAHFVLTPNSLQDLLFLVFERQEAGTLAKVPAGSSPTHFVELIISFLRLPSPLRFYRALCYYNRKSKLRVMLSKTLFNVYGCPSVHDVNLVNCFSASDLVEPSDDEQPHEELQSGFFDWFKGDTSCETLVDAASQAAEFDRIISTETAKLLKHPVFWDNLVKVLRNVFPNLAPLSPSAREAFIHLFAYYSFDAHVSVSYHVASLFYKEKMDKKEVVVLDALHGLLFISHWLLQLWKYWSSPKNARPKKTQPKIEVLESTIPVGHAFWTTLFPQGNPFALKTMMEELRLYSLTRTFVMDIYGALRAILSWIIHWVKANVLGVQDEFDVFIRQVDEIETVWVQADENTTTFQRQMVSNRKLRVKMAHLLTLGTQLKRKLEVTNGPKHLLSAVKDRLDKIRKMISGSQATFIGVEGKLKPMTCYFYGEPGVGKSIMIPHLCNDLCYVLQDEPFDKARDLYVITPKTAFHDQYAYQRFAVRNDVLQMTDEEMRTNEIFDLINMADETPYPLEIAHCEGKGQVYFTSPYLFLTSNFDIRRRTAELMSRMVEPDALIRRMDFIVRVERPGKVEGSGFQRDAMLFHIVQGRDAGKVVDWYGLVDLISDEVLDSFGVSFAANSVGLNDEERQHLNRLRDKKDGTAFVAANAAPDVAPVVQASQGITVTQALKNAGRTVSERLFKKRETPEAWYSRPATVVGSAVPPLLNKINETIQSMNPIPPPSRIERALAYMAPWGVPLSDMAYNHVTLYDYFSPLVKVGICAAGLIGAIQLFKALSSMINAVRKMKEGESIEVCPNLSGGDVEYPRGKRVMRAVGKRFMRREFPQATANTDSTWQSQNGPILEQAVYKNLCMVVAENRKVNGLFVFGHVLCLPQHIFDMVEGDVINILLPGCVQVTVDLNDMEDSEVFIAENNHLVFLNLKRYLAHYSTHADLRRYFVEATQLPSGFESQLGSIFSYRTSSLSSIGLLSRLLVTNIRPDLGNFELYDDQRCTSYNVAKSVRGSVVTMNGDCGAPWILDHGSHLGAKIAGIHVSSDRTTMTGRATMITKEMIMHVADYFGFCVPKEVEKCDDTHQTVLPQEQPPELLQSVDIVGKSDIVNPEPSRTALRHSIWYGVRPPTKVPSRLRKFKTDKGQEIDPHQVNFQKWVKETRRFPVSKIRSTYPYISQWYPRPAPDKRRVLTLEQAVFGEDDGINTSIEPNTSVGHPWKGKGYKRKDLFTLEPRWISDELRQAVKGLIDGDEVDVIVLDNLKDERLKQAKVDAGDTRIFNIFPVHFNIALKMYFGDFVHFLIQNFRGRPIRMGTSALPDDWGDLYHFLSENSGHIIAGDMGGWDHRCHFEVMMAAIEWINEWYDDDHGDVRRRLGRMSFEPYHWNNGTIFRARCGMPSGSYLTTTCNSLGVLMYIYMWAMETLGDDLPPDHGFRIRPAIYGDDHIISVFDYPELNQMSLTQWFGSYGIPYTDERKEAPTEPYTTLEAAAFLKRRFVKRKGYVWGPLEKDQLFQMIQWYRDSATTRRQTLKDRSGQILDTVLNEAFFHGPQQYAKIKKELLDWADHHACLDLSAFAPKYEEKWRLFMGDDKPSPVRYLAISVPGDLE